MPHSHAHYGGDLVDGAYGLGLFGDVATELLIRTDGDEGLFAAYSAVEFLAPLRAGDVVEATATLVRVGTRSREIDFEARVVCRRAPDRGPSAADVLDPPLLVTRARGTVVAPPRP
ncbi:hotdog domain-containing protein [Saccharothrix sp. 6-C]|uniref:3-aminobutyryl-CoA ammonia lyase n=1 Tax=Saccharothrix sp. 6-C TaxID=2781735 RepID=UPI001F1C535E|nr:hotdog domain-containing protein [Saccharothrix sp. 6-C]